MRRRLLVGLTLFGALGLGGSMIFGAEVGISGSETESYVEDLKLYQILGEKISAARNTAPGTIEGQVLMYSQIKPDVQSLGVVLGRLEVENRVYALKYPAAQAANANSDAAFKKTSEREDLLRRQIATAEDISLIQKHDKKLAAYRENMLPLLTAEDRLDGR